MPRMKTRSGLAYSLSNESDSDSESGNATRNKSKMNKKRQTLDDLEVIDEPPKKRARKSKDSVVIPPLPNNVVIPPLPGGIRNTRKAGPRRTRTSIADPIIPENKTPKRKNTKTKTKSKSNSSNQSSKSKTKTKKNNKTKIVEISSDSDDSEDDDDDKDFSENEEDSDIDSDDSIYQPLSKRVASKMKSKSNTKSKSSTTKTTTKLKTKTKSKAKTNTKKDSKNKTKSKTKSKTNSTKSSSRKDKQKPKLQKSKTMREDLNILMISDDDDSDDNTNKNKTKTKTKGKGKGKEEKSKTKGKGKKKKKEVEKRLARYRHTCSQKTRDRIDRANYQRMFMVNAEIINEHTRKYAVLGSTGNVYYVTIGQLNDCTCPDFLKGNLCKHVLFVMLKVLRVNRHNELVYQKGLLKSELLTIFNNAPQTLFGVLANDNVRTKYAKMTGNTISNENLNNNKIERKKIDGDCAICMEPMIEGKNDRKNALVWCKGQCGQNMHKQCFNEWKKNKINSGDDITCPYCRTRWIGDNTNNNASNRGRNRNNYDDDDDDEDNDEGYLNFGAEQGQDRRRDTSTYSDWGYSRWNRRRYGSSWW